MTMKNQLIHSPEEINTELGRAVKLAYTDYSMANIIIKNWYLGKTQHVAYKRSVEDKSQVQLVSSLQYMDVFTQRVTHLMAINARVVTDNLPGDVKKPFYHLLAFHTLTITADLVKSIASVRTALEELKDNNEVRLAWPGEIFENAIHVKGLLQRITTIFLKIAGTTRRLSNPPLTEDQIVFLNSIYTTESERLVLKWFLQSMPGGTWQELIPWYDNESDKTENDTIEFF
jgi:hypothetical protein